MALTKVHNRLIEGATLNVKDFGAVGDGVADDTSAIQAAINAMTAGGVLYLPEGTYRTTSEVSVSLSNQSCPY
jgi:polygalacturonase